jgi:hypothetical protein
LVLGGASASALLAAGLLGGCDTETGKADKSVTAQLDNASAEMTSGNQADLISANKQLGDAAHVSTDSLPQQLRAKSLLGDSELQLARGFIRQIQNNDAQIDRLTREIYLLGDQIQANNAQYAALGKEDPAALLDAVKQKSQLVTGVDESSSWYKNEATALPAMSADDKQASAVQTAITALADKIKTESDQRNQLLDQADKLNMQSQHEQDRSKSVDLYVQGSNLRKQAADLTVAIDQDTQSLAHTQADLTVLQGQRESLTAALKSLNDKSESFNSDWKSVQEEQAALTADSKKVLGDDPVDMPKPDKVSGDLKTAFTIGSKASAIKGLADANHELRSNAQSHLNNAISFYKEAFDLATKIKLDLGARASKIDTQKPDQAAFAAEQTAVDPGSYRFLQADAKLQQAQFYAALAGEIKVRMDADDWLKPILTTAQLTALPTLDDSDGTFATDLKKAQASARDAYKDAGELFTNVNGDTNSSELKNSAAIAVIFDQYDWSVLEAAAGDVQESAVHLTIAKTKLKEAMSENVMIPGLPPELGSVPTPAGTASPTVTPSSPRATPPSQPPAAPGSPRLFDR